MCRYAGGMHQPDRAYLSILGWPDRLTQADRVEALVASAAMDPFMAGQVVRRPTPGIVHHFDATLRDEVLGVLHGLGVLALAPTRAEMAAYPGPEAVQRVSRFTGMPPAMFAATGRDDGAWTFRAEDLRLVVVGKVRVTGKLQVHRDDGPDYQATFMVGGVEGVALRAVAESTDDAGGWGAGTSRNSRAVDMVDLHLTVNGTPRLVRLSGPATRVGLVGEERGRPSLLETQHAAGLWRELLPDAPMDTGFDQFNPPPDVEAKGGKGAARLNPVAFAFYSVWVAMLERAVRGW